MLVSPIIVVLIVNLFASLNRIFLFLILSISLGSNLVFTFLNHLHSFLYLLFSNRLQLYVFFNFYLTAVYFLGFLSIYLHVRFLLFFCLISESFCFRTIKTTLVCFDSCSMVNKR